MIAARHRRQCADFGHWSDPGGWHFLRHSARATNKPIRAADYGLRLSTTSMYSNLAYSFFSRAAAPGNWAPRERASVGLVCHEPGCWKSTSVVMKSTRTASEAYRPHLSKAVGDEHLIAGRYRVVENAGSDCHVECSEMP